MSAPLLEVVGLGVRYGMVEAVRSVSFAVDPGQAMAIIGPNGAGKSSLLNAIARIVPSSGVVRFAGEALPHAPDRVVALGISLVPEGRRVFPRLTVRENLLAGAYLRRDEDLDRDMAAMTELFPRLSERMRQSAGTLSGGEQQMLAIARGFMSRPRLLMVDEPSLGLSPRLTTEVMSALVRLTRTQGIALLMVEQNARMALRSTDRAMVMASGSIRLAGAAAELAAHPDLESLYLGG